jgi:hypothetical protein
MDQKKLVEVLLPLRLVSGLKIGQQKLVHRQTVAKAVQFESVLKPDSHSYDASRSGEVDVS